jgi:hypothetical protein
MSKTIDNTTQAQSVNKRSGMKIDPALQAAMDPHILIARATFSNGTDEQALANTVLLTFAGMGLAKAERGNHGSTWVRTEWLIALEKMPAAPFDLSPFMVRSDDGNAQPQMTESLRLILTDIIVSAQENRPEIAENITIDSTLLALAGQGLASFTRESGGKWMWGAEVDLVDRYKMGKGIEGFGNGQKPKVKIDDVLKFVFKNFFKMARTRNGHNVSRRIPTITTLLLQERHGDAVAYIDSEGQLAWKASGNLRRSFE